MENDTPQIQTQPKKSKKAFFIAIIIILLLALIGAVLWFLLLFKCPETTEEVSETTETTTELSTSTGPCTDGSNNETPSGFVFYENADLGFKFAYPIEWGSAAVDISPASSSETGDYIQGSFTAKNNVWFGGNSTDYIVGAREGMVTDLPGYLEANGKFYSVEIWKYTDGVNIEDRNNLYPIEAPYEKKTTCNTSALKTLWPASELSSVGPADVYRVNLQPENRYYGVNFVADNPDEATTSQMESLISSFQLIP